MENELKFHYMVHTSLDVVDEKISAMGKALVDQRELYLGLLYPTEDYKVYGYVTNSKVKFVMVVDSSNTALRDNEIRSMFRKLHNSYTDVMCNPFYNPGDRIQSRTLSPDLGPLLGKDWGPRGQETGLKGWEGLTSWPWGGARSPGP
nr:trafficking protein particle complex subunit 2-like protein isoform X1 [Cavia porcellus]